MARRDRLAARRKAQGWTQEALAHDLGVSVASVAHWEQGSSTPQARYRRPLAERLGVSLPELDVLLDVNGQVSPNGHAVPAWLTLYASLEQGASHIWTWQPLTVHALLQTREYAAAVESIGPSPVSDDAVAQKVDLRLSRQGVLDREPEPLELAVVLDESVLHRVTGGPTTMAAQLDHLAVQARQPNVTVQVLPLAAGVHAAAFGACTVLASNGGAAPQMAMVEDRTGHRYLESAHAVEVHMVLIDHLREHALDDDESLDMITAARERYL
ncbi:MAG: helix-turn-helix domain-containing protein [Acidimicrobiales bacterium]